MQAQSLAGLTVVVTRASAQASTLVAMLTARGAKVVEAATIKIVEPIDGGAALRDAVAELAGYDWVVLTSSNAVDRYTAAVSSADLSRSVDGVRHAVVGTSTLRTLEQAGFAADFIPSRFVGEALVEEFGAGPGRILIPGAAEMSPGLIEGLEGKGWAVTHVAAYRTAAASVRPELRAAVGAADVITFASASSVHRFCELFGSDQTPPAVVVIGPSTAAAAQQHGMQVAASADPHNLEGLVAAVVALCGTGGPTTVSEERSG